jgi:hypothetical protein
MAAVQFAMLANLPYPRVRDAVIAHLTIAEGLGSLFATCRSRRRGALPRTPPGADTLVRVLARPWTPGIWRVVRSGATVSVRTTV